MSPKSNSRPDSSRHPLRQREINYPPRYSGSAYRKSISKVSILLSHQLESPTQEFAFSRFKNETHKLQS